MKLVLMRHGATEGNERRCYVGRQTDEPLSAAGRVQCLRAGLHPEVHLVYVSGMLRARQTAQLCFPQAELRIVHGLEEFDFGDFEGRSAQDMEQDEAYRAWVESGCLAACPGGESRDGFVERSNRALYGLVREAAERGDQTLVVVAHGGTIMAALSAFGPQTDGDGYFDWHVGTCEGYACEVVFEVDQLALRDPRRFSRLSESGSPNVT